METLISNSMTPSVCNSIPSYTTSSLENNNNGSNNNLRDASFSSYLNVAGDTFADKLGKSSKSLNSHFLERREEEDGEIDVFGAEKYFNGVVDEENPKVANNKEEFKTGEDKPINHHPVKPKVCLKTPSIHSESSWNSRAALLKDIPRNHPSKKNYSSKSFLASIGCGSCSCKDKTSVDIDEQIDERSPCRRNTSNRGAHGKTITEKPIKDGGSIQYSILWEEENGEDRETHSKKNNRLGLGLREDLFTSPVLLNSGMGNLAVKMQQEDEDNEERRKSRDVFGSPIIEKRKKHSSLDRRLDMLSWDAFPRPQFEAIEVPESSNAVYNEIESNSSSDLFEIESFSNNTNSCITRQISDCMSSSVTPTCYAPSEASIGWSVVTASAVDFSEISETEEIASRRIKLKPNRVVSNGETKPGKEMYIRFPSSFLSCKNQKAVKVAGDAYKSNQKVIPSLRRNHELEPFRAASRSNTENKLMAFDYRGRQHFLEIPSPP